MTTDLIPILGISVWLIVKIFFLVGLGIYLIFALVVLRQVNIMTDTLDVGFELPVKLLAIAHFIMAIGIFLFALITL
jgi:hypothetical protein